MNGRDLSHAAASAAWRAQNDARKVADALWRDCDDDDDRGLSPVDRQAETWHLAWRAYLGARDQWHKVRDARRALEWRLGPSAEALR